MAATKTTGKTGSTAAKKSGAKKSSTQKKSSQKSGARKNPSSAGSGKNASRSGRASSAGKTSAKKSTGKAAKAAEETRRKNSRFARGFILIGLAVLTMMLYLMKGQNLWNTLHEFYLGVFGFLGFMLPVILVYCSVQMFRVRSTYRFPLKVFFFAGTVVMLATTVYCFAVSGSVIGSYGEEISKAYTEASTGVGAGVIGAFLGMPLAKLSGGIIGGLISGIVLLFFLYMSFEALFINIIDRIKEPVSEKISDRKEIRTRVREGEKQIRTETRKKAREEYVNKTVDERLRKAKQKAEDPNYRRINKTPFYEPDGIQESTQKKEKTPETTAGTNSAPERYGAGSSSAANYTSAHKRSSVGAEPSDPRDGQYPADTFGSGQTNDKLSPIPEYDSGLLSTQGSARSSLPKEPSPAETEQAELPESLDIAELVRKDQERAKIQKAQNATSAKGSMPPASSASSSAAKTSPSDRTDDRAKVRPSELGIAKPDAPEYLVPPFTLLESQPEEEERNISQELHQSATKLVETLKSFGVPTTITDICRGPAVTRYELQPASGIKISKITNLSDDIAMNLAATGVRIEAPIPGKNAVGIEVPNKIVSAVKMRGLVESREFQNAKSRLTVALGKDITGKIMLADLAKMPHLLIAGSTGSGKSVCINSMLVSLLYKSSPDEVKLILIDPKVVELGVYNGIPHLLVPVVTDPRRAAGALNWAVNEMLERYKTFAEFNVRDMYSYNRLVDKQNAEAVDSYADEDERIFEEDERTFEEDEMLAQAQAELKNSDEERRPRKLEKMCQIVIVIDELADLMMAAPKEVEESICRLAQMARAAGMHLVIATQRPSVDVITGLIKANVPSRIAFAVKSQIDSRTILDTSGAEKLLGRGDMLYSPIGISKPLRVQGCFVNDDEIEHIVDFIKHNKSVNYDTNVIDEIEKNIAAADSGKQSDAGENSDIDPVMEQAIQCVVEAGQASTSLLQRRLRLGYARAGRLIDEMEMMGIVGPHEGSKPRQVLMTYQQWLERNMGKVD